MVLQQTIEADEGRQVTPAASAVDRLVRPG
jgi:hypothetical protein